MQVGLVVVEIGVGKRQPVIGYMYESGVQSIFQPLELRHACCKNVWFLVYPAQAHQKQRYLQQRGVLEECHKTYSVSHGSSTMSLRLIPGQWPNNYDNLDSSDPLHRMLKFASELSTRELVLRVDWRAYGRSVRCHS